MKTFESLFVELVERQRTRPAGSSTVEALDAGVHAQGKKVLEEAGEVWLAAEHETPERTAQEMGQVIADATVDASLPSGHIIVIGAPLASLLAPASE